MNWTRMFSGRFLLYCGFRILSALIVLACIFSLPACKSKSSSDAELAAPSADKLELVFTYGSEKEKWITDVTTAFNREEHRMTSGKRIYVRAFPMGSGEAIDEVMDGRRQPHLISPASAAFIKLGNAQSQSKYGNDLIRSTDNLV